MLLMQRLESGAPRVHLDIHTDDLDAEVARLVNAKAHRPGRRGEPWRPPGRGAGIAYSVSAETSCPAQEGRLRMVVRVVPIAVSGLGAAEVHNRLV